MRKQETGGVLLVVVTLVALATFAYIGFVLTRDPEKAEIVSEGVEEATEGADEEEKTGVEPDVTAVATLTQAEDGSYSVVYGEHVVSIIVGEASDVAYQEQPAEAREITFADEQGRAATLTRTYLVDQPVWFDPLVAEAVYIDYDRTYRYATVSVEEDTGDPLRGVMEFNGEGLYFWVYGGLYYYDPATGTFGLNLEHSP